MYDHSNKLPGAAELAAHFERAIYRAFAELTAPNDRALCELLLVALAAWKLDEAERCLDRLRKIVKGERMVLFTLAQMQPGTN
jgi:hypothetical protein